MSKLAQDISSVSAELFEGRLAQDINSVDAELVQETTVLSLTAPANGQTGVALSMTFSWTDSESRGLYRLLYDTDINFGNPTEVWTESTSYNATLTSGTYYWKVEAHNTVQQPAIPTGTIQNDSEAGDIESLQLFYDNLGGASWTDNTGWASTGMSLDPAPFGITTAEINGETRVTEIDLVANNLIGTLPEFPGLQECNVYLVKQAEGSGTGDKSTPPARITGEIPSSLGQTKITELSLCGRTSDDYRTATGNFYNKKNGKAWNQFSGSLPPELYNLSLTFLEIDGLDGQFNGELDSRCGNWTLDRFLATGNFWYQSDGNPSLDIGSFTGQIPSEIKNWDSEVLLIEDNAWTGIALDAFEGWTEKEDRWIMVGNDGDASNWYWNQSLPTISVGNFAKFSWGGRFITGEFPNQFFQGIGSNRLYEFGFGTHNFSGSVQPGLLANFGNTLRFSIARNSVKPMNLSGELFGLNESAAGYFANNMILFYTQSNRILESYVPEGMHEWTDIRYVYMNDMSLKGTLPSKPPGMYGPTLRSVRFERRSDQLGNYTGEGLTGSIPADWGNIGSTEAYGGELANGTITGFGDDATGFYIEDSNASYTVNEFQPDSETARGPFLRHPASNSNSLRRVISNTATRIYYETVTVSENEIGFTDLQNGNVYQVKRNSNTDVRDLSEGVNLSNNSLSGTLLAEAAPDAMVGGTYNIEGNNFTVKDFVDNIQVWLDLATANGWNFAYANQKDFGGSQPDINVEVGDFFEIDFSEFGVLDASYTWFFEGTTTSDNGPVLQRTNAQETDSGIYRLEITHPDVPNMTSTSIDVNVTVTPIE